MNVCPHSFEDLWIWQEARLLVAAIYSDFGPNSPGARDYIFKGQIQGCGISIMNNIAEGFERETIADYARFLDITKGSCGEVRSMYYVAEDVRYVTAEIAKERRAMALKITKGLSSLTQKLRQPHNTP
ncbi:MAG: four helix bundle protein [bacterium]|nr:four helix bundle protein [bacterium]